ncbi:methyltransferase [Sorangium sp. So ce1024]|uniref:methyltransferase n=1 Tax=unclassified Sorangium TaxID=2621164 RepID=UPI003F0951AA
MSAKLEVPSSDDRLLRQLCLSIYHAPTVSAAIELDLFSILDRAPATIEEVGARLKLSPRAAEALLATLASLGLLAQQQGKFAVTELSRNYLLPTKPYYWGHMLRMLQEIPVSHTRILEALRRDQPVEGGGEGKALSEVWEAVDVPPERAALITRAMHSVSMATAVGLAHRADLSGVRRLLDVAGGSGCFCIALALRHPEVRFTVADLPAVGGVAQEYIAEYGLKDRIDVVGLDMFRDPWPPGHDAIFFANILHDWDRARCLHLLRRSFEALPAGGRIFIHEILLSDTQDGPLTAALLSINMVYLTQGKQFTAAELTSLLHESGFEDVAITPVLSEYSLVSARKPRVA